MAFTKEEMSERPKRLREQLIDEVEENLDEMEEQLNQIKTNDRFQVESQTEFEMRIEEDSKKAEEEPAFKATTGRFSLDLDQPKQIAVETINAQLKELEFGMASLWIDDKSSFAKTQNFPEEVILPAIEEYQEWLEDQDIVERIFDIKEEVLEVEQDLENPEKEIPSLDLFLDEQKECLSMIKQVESLFQEQETKFYHMKRELDQLTAVQEKIQCKFRITSQVLLRSGILYQTLSKAKLPRLVKFVLQTKLLSQTMRMSRSIVEETPPKMPTSLEKQLKTASFDLRYTQTILNNAQSKIKKAKQNFKNTFQDYRGQLLEYDKLYQQFEKMENSLNKQEQNLVLLQQNMEKQIQKRSNYGIFYMISFFFFY